MLGLNALEAGALPAGFQEFYLPLPADLARQIFVNIDNDPAVSAGMHYVVGVTASADNTTVYYDHWENGLLSGAAGDQVVHLSKGQVYYFESSNIPSSPRGTGTYYDGGDRIFVAGSLLQTVVSIWPESPGTVFTDAWEVYPLQAWEADYVVPVGEDLAGAPTNYTDFTKVWLLIMSGSDGNSIQITDPKGAGLATTLNRGKTVIYEVKGAGTTVSGSGKIQVQLMTGRFNSGGASEMRGYTLTPRAYWGKSYVAPVPSWPSKSSYTNLYLYNPNPSTITINFRDLSGSGSFTIAAGKTRSYRDGTGRYIPAGSGVYLESSSTFWGIAAGDTGSATWDWGYDLIPTNFLTTDNYVSWAPGTSNRTANGSPVFVTALNDNTTVFVDFGPNDGVFDATYNLNRLQAIEIYGRNNDNTGMHIVSTDLVAVAWGESPLRAGTGTPYLDMGYTTLPLPIEWIEVALQVEKTADPTAVQVNGEAEFTIVISVPATAAQATNVDLVDKLPPGWEYLAGSGSPSDPTSITGSLSSGYTLTWDANWTIDPGSSRTVRFRARATASADTTNPNRNVATATGQSLGATLTADDDAFVRVSAVVVAPAVQATKSAELAVDADGDGVPSPGDTLEYTIAISNSGTGPAQGGAFTDTPDLNTSLVAGSVDVSGCPGCLVTSGNAPGDTSVGVAIGSLAPGAAVTIYFRVTIKTDGFTSVANQGTVGGTNFGPVLTDDPATPAPHDPTVTPVTIAPPALTITKAGPTEATVGSAITYTGTLTNPSESTAYNAVLVDYLPSGVSFLSSSHTAVYDPVHNTVTWYLGDIPPGATIPGWVTVYISASVSDGTVLHDRFSLTWEDHLGNDYGPATATWDTVAHTLPALALEKTGPSAASMGEVFSYTLKLRNLGGLAATNVALEDALPGGVDYISSNPSGSYNLGTHTITWSLGTIAPGGTRTVIVTVRATAPGTLTDTATVTWQDPDGNPYGPVSASWATEVYTAPELTITKFGPPEATVDSTITYTGTLCNVGGSTAMSVVLVDYLPSGVRFVSSSHSAIYDPESNTVTWYLPDLPPGGCIPGWLAVYIGPAVPDGTVLTDRFSVTWAGGGPAEATCETIVHTYPLLTVDKTGPEQAHPGELLTYTIEVRNLGGTAAMNVTVTDLLPIGLSYVSSSPPGVGTTVITWSLGTIPPSGVAEISLTVRVESAVGNNTTLIDTVSVSWQDSLGRGYGPATDAQATTIYTRPQLVLAKSGPGVAYPGKSFSYTIEVCNLGGTAALNVTVSDHLPEGLNYGNSNPGGSYDPGTRTITWSLGTINSGACRTITLTVTVAGAVPEGTLLVDLAEASWRDSAGNDYGPVSAAWETIIHTSPHLVISKTGPTRAYQGDQLTYTIEVCNRGGAVATNVTLQDLLPIGLDYVSSNPSGTHTDGIVTWALGALAPDECRSVSLTTRVAFGLPAGKVLLDTACAVWQDPDGNGYGPSCATAETRDDPALVVVKEDLVDAVYPGGTVTYTTTYRNLSETVLTGVVLTESYDPNVAFISASPPPDPGTDNQWTIGNLAPGASGTIRVTVRVAQGLPNGTILHNEVWITSAEGAEADDTETTTVVALNCAEFDPPGGIWVGDVNQDGQIDLADAQLIARFALGLALPTPVQKGVADVALPLGVIDIRDAIRVAEYALGITPPYCPPGYLEGAGSSGLKPPVPPPQGPSEAMRTVALSVEVSGTKLLLRAEQALLGLQAGPTGALRFDPKAMQLKAVRGLGSYRVLASQIDNERGEARFMLLALSEPRAGELLEIELAAPIAGDGLTELGLNLSVDLALDAEGREVAIALASGMPLPLRLERVFNAPNPVGTRGATRFTVLGTGIAAVRVQVFDLSGQRVFTSDWAPGASLEWRLLNARGQPVANGVYLYLIEVRGYSGQTSRSRVQKLVVLK